MPDFRRNLISYLRKLTGDDLTKIGKYLESPFFKVTNRQRVIALFKYLRRLHPEYEKAKTENDYLERKLGFPNIKNLKTNLLDAVTGYLEIKSLYNNEQIKTYLLADTLDDLKLEDEFERSTKEEIELLDKKRVKQPVDYMLKYQLLLLQYFNTQSLTAKNTILGKAIESFDYFYLYNSLINFHAYEVNIRQANAASVLKQTAAIVEAFNNKYEISDPNILYSYYVFQALQAKDNNELKDIFYQVKEIAFSQWNDLTSDIKYEIYLSMRNIATIIKSNDSSFNNELFLINEFCIDKNVHITRNEIESGLFYETIKNACDVSKFDWCETFIAQNKTHLKPAEEDAILDISHAYLNFKLNKFDDAISNLVSTRHLNYMYNLNGRAIEIRCLYELKDPDRFEAAYRRFNRYLNENKKIPHQSKTGHLNFVKFLVLLEKSRYNNTKVHLEEAIQQLNNEPQVYYRGWLNEKFAALKK